MTVPFSFLLPNRFYKRYGPYRVVVLFLLLGVWGQSTVVLSSTCLFPFLMFSVSALHFASWGGNHWHGKDVWEMPRFARALLGTSLSHIYTKAYSDAAIWTHAPVMPPMQSQYALVTLCSLPCLAIMNVGVYFFFFIDGNTVTL